MTTQGPMTINEYLRVQHAEYRKRHGAQYSPQAKAIKCADGLRLSVQASAGHYCEPREDFGPWSMVEVGFPSERVEDLMPYAETPSDPTNTVYGWVPVEVVERVIEAHGWIAQ